MQESHFWLAIILGLATIIATVAISCTYIIHTKAAKMAELGYTQKVVVIGNPSDTYSRVITTTWVPKDSTPQVENK